jgi:hypothetical protein
MWQNSYFPCNARAPPRTQTKKLDIQYWNFALKRLEQLLQEPTLLNASDLPHTEVVYDGRIVKVHGIVHGGGSRPMSQTCRSQIIEFLRGYDQAGEQCYLEGEFSLSTHLECEVMTGLVGGNYLEALFAKRSLLDVMCSSVQGAFTKIDQRRLSRERMDALKKSHRFLYLALNDVRWLPAAREAYELTDGYGPYVTTREKSLLDQYFRAREESMILFLGKKIPHCSEKVIHVVVGLFHERQLASMLSRYQPEL